MVRPHHAREKLSVPEALALLDEVDAHAGKILARVRQIAPLPDDAAILDVGAGQGLFVLCCARRGYRAVGVEPSAQARVVAEEITRLASSGPESRMQHPKPVILPGTAESLPFPAGQFDLVHANSVIEHATDPAAACREAHRVLKAGGVFWFSTTSSLCPRQNEIALFPLFGWYPDWLKRRIMTWAKVHQPGLIGHTGTPAMHWFTVGKARRMLAEAGFRRVLDRWDFRLETEGGRAYRAAGSSALVAVEGRVAPPGGPRLGDRLFAVLLRLAGWWGLAPINGPGPVGENLVARPVLCGVCAVRRDGPAHLARAAGILAGLVTPGGPRADRRAGGVGGFGRRQARPMGWEALCRTGRFWGIACLCKLRRLWML